MTARQIFEIELSGEPLTQEDIEWVLEKYAKMAWEHGFNEGFIEGKYIDGRYKNITSKFEDFLKEKYDITG